MKLIRYSQEETLFCITTLLRGREELSISLLQQLSVVVRLRQNGTRNCAMLALRLGSGEFCELKYATRIEWHHHQ